MKSEEIQEVLDNIKYKEGWKLYYHFDAFGIGNYLQWILPETDENGFHWKGRKWYISLHMTPSELVQTAFMAALAAEEHECREAFKYRGLQVLSPHHDLDILADNMVTGMQIESVRKEQI
jgi:hypothetical protein